MSQKLLDLAYRGLDAIKSKAPFDKEANFQYALGHQIEKLDPEVQVDLRLDDPSVQRPSLLVEHRQRLRESNRP